MINYAAVNDPDKLYPMRKQLIVLEHKIEKDNERMVQGVKDRLKQNGVFDSTSKIPGYPDGVIDSPQVSSLENGYSNAAAWYTAGFVSEMMASTGSKDTGAMEDSYKRALKIRGDIPLFKETASGLFESAFGKKKHTKTSDSKKTNKQEGSKETTDLLVIIEGGQLSDLYTYKKEMPIVTPNGPGKVTYAIPALKDNAQLSSFQNISIGGNSIPLYEAANLEYMSRRDLKDWLPEYISAASASVATQIALETVANSQIDKGVGGVGGTLLKGVAAQVIGTVGDEDTRSWKTMPAQIFIGRARIPKGTSQIQLTGVSAQKPLSITLDSGYKILHLRVINNIVFSTNQI